MQLGRAFLLGLVLVCSVITCAHANEFTEYYLSVSDPNLHDCGLVEMPRFENRNDQMVSHEGIRSNFGCRVRLDAETFAKEHEFCFLAGTDVNEVEAMHAFACEVNYIKGGAWEFHGKVSQKKIKEVWETPVVVHCAFICKNK